MALSKSSSPKQISLFPSEAAGLSTAPAKPLPSYLKDHRKRLRERFDRAGLAAMPDYELLELVLFRALQLNASALILVHNHPSGNPQPSPQDRTLTAQIVAAADAVGICIHDHLIIGRGDSFSFRSEGLL